MSTGPEDSGLDPVFEPALVEVDGVTIEAWPEALVCPGCGKQIEDFRSDGTWGCHSCGERGDWASE